MRCTPQSWALEHLFSTWWCSLGWIRCVIKESMSLVVCFESLKAVSTFCWFSPLPGCDSRYEAPSTKLSAPADTSATCCRAISATMSPKALESLAQISPANSTWCGHGTLPEHSRCVNKPKRSSRKNALLSKVILYSWPFLGQTALSLL